MKNDNFAYPYNDYREPDWHEGPHHPYKDGVHHKHWRPWNDTEPAANWEPWCPPHPIDDCICVTQNDVDRWNSVSGISAVTGLNFEKIEELEKLDIPLSADYWNSTYETVDTNSAFWNNGIDLPEFSAKTEDQLDNIKKFLDVLSAKKLEKLHVNTSYYDEVYSQEVYGHPFEKNPDYPYVLNGNGTSGMPLELSEHVVDLLYYLEHGKPRHTIESLKPGQSSVPNPLPFVTNDTYEIMKGNYVDLLKKYNSNTSQLVELAGLVQSLISLIQGGDGKISWENKQVTLEESKKNINTFYYWSSK